MTEQEIESRIKAEYKKHKNLDWAKIAAKKIHSQIQESKILGYHDVEKYYPDISHTDQKFIDNAH